MPPCSLQDLEHEGKLSHGLDPSSKRLLETFHAPLSYAPPRLPGEEISVTDLDSQLLAMHRLLQQLDPQEAVRWHWRDGRKVRRAVERWWEARASELLSEHEDAHLAAKESVQEDEESGKARYGCDIGLEPGLSTAHSALFLDIEA